MVVFKKRSFPSRGVRILILALTAITIVRAISQNNNYWTTSSTPLVDTP